MASGTYVKTIKFDADTTKVLNSLNAISTESQSITKKFGQGFFSPELKRNLSEFRRGLLSAFDISSSEELKNLRSTLDKLLDEKKQLEEMRDNVKGQMEGKDKRTTEYKELKKTLEQINDKLKDTDDKIFDTQDDINISKEQSAKQFSGKLGAAAGKKVVSVFKDIGKQISKFLVSMFKEALKKLEEIASYDLQNSIKFNQTAIDLATQYGLVGEEAYAAQKAAEFMGYGSVDTLVENMWNMNDAQLAEFQRLQQQYRDSYENDKQLAIEYQNFMNEWTHFKEDFQMELLEWFSSNKDTITNVMSMLMSFMTIVLDMLSAITEAFGGAVERSDSQRAAAANDIIQSYRASSSNNVNVSNTFNVNGTNLQSNQELQNAGSTTYRQIINAFK